MTSASTWGPQQRARERELLRDLSALPDTDPRRAAVRDELVTMHLPLVQHLARRYQGRGESLDDLVQVGTVGLIQAVDRFDVDSSGDPDRFRAAVTCSSGTFVRSLAADLGHAVGSGAHLTALRRTRVGPFTLDEATSLEQVEPDVLLPPSAIGRLLPSVTVDGVLAAEVGHGAVVDRDRFDPSDGDGPWAVLDPAGDLLAVYRQHTGGRVKPVVVLARQ